MILNEMKESFGGYYLLLAIKKVLGTWGQCPPYLIEKGVNSNQLQTDTKLNTFSDYILITSCNRLLVAEEAAWFDCLASWIPSASQPREGSTYQMISNMKLKYLPPRVSSVPGTL